MQLLVAAEIDLTIAFGETNVTSERWLFNFHPGLQERLRREIYRNDVDRVDLLVGLLAEDLPKGFGFSDTAFRIFILMASRRLKSDDRFFTDDYRSEIYTDFGMDWIRNNGLKSVLMRHVQQLGPALEGVDNGFAPWNVL